MRNQLKAPEWGRIVGVKSSEDNENIEVWVRNENGKVTGVAILASESARTHRRQHRGQRRAGFAGRSGRPVRPPETAAGPEEEVGARPTQNARPMRATTVLGCRKCVPLKVERKL